jgi:hypothetical protein
MDVVIYRQFLCLSCLLIIVKYYSQSIDVFKEEREERKTIAIFPEP